MKDVWLILCAAAAMLTAVPALRRLDAYIGERMEREAAGEEQVDQTPEPERTEKWGPVPFAQEWLCSRFPKQAMKNAVLAGNGRQSAAFGAAASV